jgi:UDP-N-acetylmuramoyl-L-alanyl-D-glutamate--2,6-diaminopimelate ligase
LANTATNSITQPLEPLVDVLRRAGNLLSEQSGKDASVSDIAYDSRNVTAGSAFFCIPGEKSDGNRFIPEAIKRGATVIFTESESAVEELSAPATLVRVSDVRLALAQIADSFYGHPSTKLRLIGVTGTNGKTTTTHLVEHIFAHAGLKVGLIGTLGVRTNVDGKRDYTDMHHTTPQASDLQKLLYEMQSTGVTNVAMEVSSHALALKRAACCNFASACLTNLTQDHLDFHKTMEHYFQAKKLLFEDLNRSKQTNKTAVVNVDDPSCARFLEAIEAPVRIWKYGWQKGADAYVEAASFDFTGTKLGLITPAGSLDLKLRLNGKFNVYNVMAAILLALAEGVSLENCRDALADFDGVSGRFEAVMPPAPFNERQPLCLVDYAHTPDGLENVLKSARALVPEKGRLVAVFGCGGDRDASKRPQMGEIAEALADQLYVTSDNPRSEDPEKIIADILAGIKRIKSVKVEPDRAAAIKSAILDSSPEDIIVIAGKGHETYQILKDKTIDFDDRRVAKEALIERAKGSE